MDFAALLSSGETLSTNAVTIALVLGTDASPSGHISGVASVSGSTASQTFDWSGTAINGNRYVIQFLVTTSLGQKFSAWSYVSIQSPG